MYSQIDTRMYMVFIYLALYVSVYLCVVSVIYIYIYIYAKKYNMHMVYVGSSLEEVELRSKTCISPVLGRRCPFFFLVGAGHVACSPAAEPAPVPAAPPAAAPAAAVGWWKAAAPECEGRYGELPVRSSAPVEFV